MKNQSSLQVAFSQAEVYTNIQKVIHTNTKHLLGNIQQTTEDNKTQMCITDNKNY